VKKIVVLFIIILISFKLFADAGSAYRYEATLKLRDNSEITGFFFFTTYERGYNENKTDFEKYILTYYHFPIRVFEEIKTIEINKYLTVDIAIIGSERTINKNEIISIDLISEIETKVGSRLIEISEQEFNLLNQDFINSERIHNESYSENCSYYLLTWKQSNDLVKMKKEIHEKIDKLRLENNYEVIREYIDQLKLDLIKQKTIIFQYCSAL